MSSPQEPNTIDGSQEPNTGNTQEPNTGNELEADTENETQEPNTID